MDDIAAKRVFAERSGATRLLVAANAGVAAVTVADDRVGEFGLLHRCSPRDLAVGPAGRLAVATDEDVFIAGRADADLEPTGFGAAVCVDVGADRVVAASPDGRIGVLADDWTTLGQIDARPTAIDGDLVGAPGGVYRLGPSGLASVGLTAIADIAHVAGVPHAATASGLYALGNGWMDVLDGLVESVWGARDGRGFAAVDTSVYRRVDGSWHGVDFPTEVPLAAMAFGEQTYAIDESGTLSIEQEGEWRGHATGLREAVGMAVLPE